MTKKILMIGLFSLVGGLVAKEVPVLSQKRVNTYVMTLPDDWQISKAEDRQFVAGNSTSRVMVLEKDFKSLDAALKERDSVLGKLFKDQANLEGSPTIKTNDKFQYQYLTGFSPLKGKIQKNISTLTILKKNAVKVETEDGTVSHVFHGFIIICAEPAPVKGGKPVNVCEPIIRSMQNADKNMGGKKAFKLLADTDSLF